MASCKDLVGSESAVDPGRECAFPNPLKQCKFTWDIECLAELSMIEDKRAPSLWTPDQKQQKQ